MEIDRLAETIFRELGRHAEKIIIGNIGISATTLLYLQERTMYYILIK